MGKKISTSFLYSCTARKQKTSTVQVRFTLKFVHFLVNPSKFSPVSCLLKNYSFHTPLFSQTLTPSFGDKTCLLLSCFDERFNFIKNSSSFLLALGQATGLFVRSVREREREK